MTARIATLVTSTPVRAPRRKVLSRSAQIPRILRQAAPPFHVSPQHRVHIVQAGRHEIGSHAFAGVDEELHGRPTAQRCGTAPPVSSSANRSCAATPQPHRSTRLEAELWARFRCSSRLGFGGRVSMTTPSSMCPRPRRRAEVSSGQSDVRPTTGGRIPSSGT